MASKKSFKNNVTRLLDSKHVTYSMHEYDYDAGVRSAVEVAAAIGLPPAQVFKTLVALPDGGKSGSGSKGGPRAKPLLVVIPGPATLDLKALAKAVGSKKARMATHEEAEALTNLQTGGISPLALINRGFAVYIDEHAHTFESIAVSAGQRGANVVLPVADLIKLTQARVIRLD